ncbi:hypothetical protein [Breoghania sp.]|uniref:hypothetical protein n=1 Tax=Breoghania sp. TaxID=2065378 RepID=UPI00262DE2BE|nr:hypothetical protein [Breoghania sp.]MDJ0931606.1 hypothetical protein [Breoghania sp.]
MLTFESMIAMDPASGGFTAGFEGGAPGANQTGAPSGQFATQLSVVMNGNGTQAGGGGAVVGVSAVNSASGTMSATIGNTGDATGSIQSDIGVVIQAGAGMGSMQGARTMFCRRRYR